MLVVVACVAGCQAFGIHWRDDLAMSWPEDWSRHLGQVVTLKGKAANAKLGALLEGDGRIIWIDGLHEWPEGFYLGEGKGKHLLVTGTVIKRDDMPVFVQEPGGPVKAGIPVRSKADLEKGRGRFLLTGVKWTVLE
jgi:hypothetical protein